MSDIILSKDILIIVEQLFKKLYQNYIGNNLDSLWLLGTYFDSPAIQSIKINKILPITKNSSKNILNNKFFIYEPSQMVLLDMLIPKYFSMLIYQSILESITSEHAARMRAMESATKNASEAFNMLTLQYNRARQASITNELMEIISGAEALK